MKRALIENFIDEKLDHANSLKALFELDRLTKQRIHDLIKIKNRQKFQKDEIKCLFFLEKRIQVVLPVMISQADEEQSYLLVPEYQRTDIVKYRYLCCFKLSYLDIKDIRGYEKLLQNGYYHHVNNPNGVVKDHRLSIKSGFVAKINPDLLSHPSNCEFLTFKENGLKSSNNSITLVELQEEIKVWNSIRNVKNKRWKKFESA